MAAGPIQVTIKDGTGTSRNMTLWSSDGTLAGNLASTFHVVDGEIETIGAKADAAYTGSGSASQVAIQKGMYAQLATLTGYPVNNATSRLLSAAATTNATSVKASTGAIVSIQGYNAKASAVYLKLYNKASAPTVGTDTPVKTLYIPASAAFVFDFPVGSYFSTGIAYAITGAAADADTTALAAGDVLCLNVDYI